jgi:hypothetical protein
MTVKLGRLLLDEGLISPQQLQQALEHQRVNGRQLAAALIRLGFVSDEAITQAISRKCGVPSVDLEACEVDPAILKLIPADLVRKYQVLPLSRSGTTLDMAMADPTDTSVTDAIRFLTGYDVKPVVASEFALTRAIRRHYGPPPPPMAAHHGSARANVSPEQLGVDGALERLSRKYRVPCINLHHFTIDPAIIRIIPAETARTHKVLPLCRSGATLTIAMADPSDVVAMDDIRFMTGFNIEPVVVTERSLRDSINHYYASSHPGPSCREPTRPDEASTKRYACLFASWKDGSYWIGEVRGDRCRGLHVTCRAGREKCETRARGDANDRAVTVAEGVDFLMTLRAAEVESRFATDGPPLTVDAVFVESGDPFKMESLLKKRERAWQRARPRSNPAWLPWVTLPLTLSALSGLRPSSFSPSSFSLTIFVGVALLGFVAVGFLVFLESWQVKRLRRKAWRA